MFNLKICKFFCSAEENDNNDLDSLPEDEVLPFDPEEATDPVEVWHQSQSNVLSSAENWHFSLAANCDIQIFSENLLVQTFSGILFL